MSVIQEAFYIPEDIAVKLLSGEYSRMGGIVRYAVGSRKGQIVKHLEPIDIRDGNAWSEICKKISEFAVKNKNGLIVAGVAVAIAGGIIWYTSEKKEPVSISVFKRALKRYINAIRNGALCVETINDLLEALETLSKEKNKDNFLNALDAMDSFVDRIYEYTVKLAADNNVVLAQNVTKKNNCTIISLQDYLKAQRDIFSQCE